MAPKSLTHKQKLEALRAEMRRGGLDGFIVPRADKYQGEFVGADAERLAWLTGFTGSAGTAVVLADRAAVLSDGRYTIQLAQQVNKTLYDTEDSVKIPPSLWIASHARKGQCIGYDPWLHTPKQLEYIERSLAEKGILIKAVKDNLVDRNWLDRPPAPRAKAEVFPGKAAGLSSARKKDSIARILKKKNLLASIIAMPDSLMWLLNVRGGDMEETPVVLSQGIVYTDGRPVQWFADPAKITSAVRKHIGDVEIIAPGEIGAHVDALAAESKQRGRAVALDFARSPAWFRQRLAAGGATVLDFKDPCVLPKALKTKPEQDSIKEAHIKDGAAMVKFLHWLEDAAGKGKLTEIKATDRLEQFRKEDKAYRGPSFPTIAGFGPNGAIVHYRATEKTDRPITSRNLLLLDSGGQYHYGTTDITRTIAIGHPSQEMMRNFTLVLKGHIAVARAKFPPGTTGAQIDALARQPLWQEGLDYAHGTGHGVGCYLSVHEEAAGISTRGTEALEAGMLISNEPGYYKEGHYGIRIENLVLVKKSGGMLGFETVTLAPLDRALIQADMLTREEKKWLNAYHARVFKTLAPRLDQKRKTWLQAQTRAL